MKKFVALMLALVLALSCTFVAVAEEPTTLAVCLASEPDTLDPALNSAVDGATMILHLFSGLAKWAEDDAGNLVIVADAAEELVEGVENADGTITYTYTLKDGLKWSDGQALTAKDFEFAWKRAASSDLGADYGYMFDQVKGYPDELAVKATDDKTLEVVVNSKLAYWNELLAFPTYFPVREDVVANEAWATAPETYVSNGAYTMSAWEHNSKITLAKNPNYHEADTVTLDVLECYLSDDDNNMLANFESDTWQMIDSVPLAEIKRLEAEYPTEYRVVGQIGTYYACWNVNENLLPADSTLTGAEAEAANAEIRKALGLLLDRNYITAEVSQAGEVPASGFVPMGMTDFDGNEFYKNANSTEDDFDGYYDVSEDAYFDNWETAIEILKKYYEYDEETYMFTNIPSMEYLYNTADNHKAIGEYLQGVYASVGITMNLVNQEWATFLNTRKDGQYTVARNGWLADYNDPISFLDMWISASGNNDVQFGKGAHEDLYMYDLDLSEYGMLKVENGTWGQTYDVLIDIIKGCSDNELRYELMHIAEDMLMSTGCLTPIYFYTDPFMIKDSVEGFFCNPLGYKYFMYTTIAE